MHAEPGMLDDGAQHHERVEREEESEIPVQADRREQAPQAGSEKLHPVARLAGHVQRNSRYPKAFGNRLLFEERCGGRDEAGRPAFSSSRP